HRDARAHRDAVLVPGRDGRPLLDRLWSAQPGAALARQLWPLRSLRSRIMRFMIMHKNDANTEAGLPPPKEIVQKMGAFIGEHMKAGRFLDGAGLAGSKTRTRLIFREGRST